MRDGGSDRIIIDPRHPRDATLMSVFQVTKGLDIPIVGEPAQVVGTAQSSRTVAILARDYVGTKHRLLVEPGVPVLRGQPILAHRAYPEIRFVSPASGVVELVNRGEKRALQSVVVSVDPDGAQHAFEAFRPHADASRAHVLALLLESGLWTAFRTRPFSRIPDPSSVPASVFVTAIDTQPLAPDVDVALRGREEDFARGVSVLTQLTDGPVFICRRSGSVLGDGLRHPRVRVAEFSGPHPAGTVGYHIHVLDPVSRGKTVWHVGAQDVARIGHLFATGVLDVSQVVAIGGPKVVSPRLVRTTLGASMVDLLDGELHAGATRVISGSVLSGDRADDERFAYLGRFHQQVSVIVEGAERRLLGWMAPGARMFSALPVFVSSLLPRRRFALDTGLHGSRRAMVPIGAYERVMPMDLMPTHLLRALTVGDIAWAEELGALELDEEDLALCAFVCPGKYEYGTALRRVLTTMAAEA